MRLICIVVLFLISFALAGKKQGKDADDEIMRQFQQLNMENQIKFLPSHSDALEPLAKALQIATVNYRSALITSRYLCNDFEAFKEFIEAERVVEGANHSPGDVRKYVDFIISRMSMGYGHAIDRHYWKVKMLNFERLMDAPHQPSSSTTSWTLSASIFAVFEDFVFDWIDIMLTYASLNAHHPLTAQRLSSEDYSATDLQEFIDDLRGALRAVDFRLDAANIIARLNHLRDVYIRVYSVFKASNDKSVRAVEMLAKRKQRMIDQALIMTHLLSLVMNDKEFMDRLHQKYVLYVNDGIRRYQTFMRRQSSSQSNRRSRPSTSAANVDRFSQNQLRTTLDAAKNTFREKLSSMIEASLRNDEPLAMTTLWYFMQHFMDLSNRAFIAHSYAEFVVKWIPMVPRDGPEIAVGVIPAQPLQQQEQFHIESLMPQQQPLDDTEGDDEPVAEIQQPALDEEAIDLWDYRLWMPRQEADALPDDSLSTASNDVCKHLQSDKSSQRYVFADAETFIDIKTRRFISDLTLKKRDMATLCQLEVADGATKWTDFVRVITRLGGVLARKGGSKRTLHLPVKNWQSVRIDEPHGAGGETLGRCLASTIREILREIGIPQKFKYFHNSL